MCIRDRSGAVHGIVFEDLLDAPTVSAVVEDLLPLLEGKIPVSDAPEFDRRWLSRLLRASGHATMPKIEDYHDVSFAQFSGLALDMVYENLERHPAPHRAGPDSARLVRAWRKAQQY